MSEIRFLETDFVIEAYKQEVCHISQDYQRLWGCEGNKQDCAGRGGELQPTYRKGLGQPHLSSGPGGTLRLPCTEARGPVREGSGGGRDLGR